MDEVWLTTAEAAKHLGGVTTRTVYRMVNDGEFPAYKIGRCLKFKQSDLDGYLAACVVSKEQT